MLIYTITLSDNILEWIAYRNICPFADGFQTHPKAVPTSILVHPSWNLSAAFTSSAACQDLLLSRYIPGGKHLLTASTLPTLSANVPCTVVTRLCTPYDSRAISFGTVTVDGMQHESKSDRIRSTIWTTEST